MRDYTYQDMLKMQEEAAKRVREMKKRAAIAVEDESGFENIPTTVRKVLPDEVKHISYPVELPGQKEEQNEKQNEKQNEERNEEHGEKKKSPSGILSFITQDKDALLILALLAVIGQDEKDYLTSLALIYLLL